MATILFHQLHENLRSLRFQLSLVILLLFFVANGAVYTMKTTDLATESATAIAIDADRYDEVKTLRDAIDTSYKIRTEAVGNEFIAEAGSNWFLYAMFVSPRYGDSPDLSSSRTTNRWMRRFEVVDWSLIVRYVLSFLCIVLAYNAISGEIENGTLRLALANPLSRAAFLSGKFLAHLATLLGATALGCLVSLLILALNGAVALNLATAAACGYFFFGTTLYAALFLALGMGISALARTSATALVLLVTLWTVLIIVIPQTSYLVAISKVPNSGALWDQLDQHRDQVYTTLQQEGIAPRPVDLAKADNYALEKRYAQRLRQMGSELDQFVKTVEQRELRQYKLAAQINLLSPGFAFQYTLEAFLCNGVQRFEDFARQGWQYRDTLRQFFQDRDREDPDSPHVFFLPEFMSERKLDPNHIPRFKAKPLKLADSLSAGAPSILLLVLEAALAVFFALWAFNRAELTA